MTYKDALGHTNVGPSRRFRASSLCPLLILAVGYRAHLANGWCSWAPRGARGLETSRLGNCQAHVSEGAQSGFPRDELCTSLTTEDPNPMMNGDPVSDALQWCVVLHPTEGGRTLHVPQLEREVVTLSSNCNCHRRPHTVPDSGMLDERCQIGPRLAYYFPSVTFHHLSRLGFSRAPM